MKNNPSAFEKEQKFRPTREELRHAVDEFLRKGGKINKLEATEAYYDYNPVYTRYAGTLEVDKI